MTPPSFGHTPECASNSPRNLGGELSFAFGSCTCGATRARDAWNAAVEACAAALRNIPATTLARFARNNWSAVELTKHLAELLLKDLKVK